MNYSQYHDIQTEILILCKKSQKYTKIGKVGNPVGYFCTQSGKIFNDNQFYSIRHAYISNFKPPGEKMN